MLGPPSSGKTTLLLALAGRLDPSLRVDGEISYNGHKLNEFEPRRTSAYVSQNDIHVGEMTVKETLDFSARCQGIGTRLGNLTSLFKKIHQYNYPKINNHLLNILFQFEIELFIRINQLHIFIFRRRQ